MKIEFHAIEDINEERIKFVTLLTLHNEKLVFVKHRDRNSWEFPGGHIEPGETCIEAARRELHEETGARDFDLFPLLVFNVKKESDTSKNSFSKFYLADVHHFGTLPDFEIEKVETFDKLPDNLTYKEIQEALFIKYSSMGSENNLITVRH